MDCISSDRFSEPDPQEGSMPNNNQQDYLPEDQKDNKTEDQPEHPEHHERQHRTGARGTAAMDPQTRQEVARKGGLAVSRNRAHMAEIGRKGGQSVSRNREHMAKIGRKGGAASRGGGGETPGGGEQGSV
jgi:general stress protein YciG